MCLRCGQHRPDRDGFLCDDCQGASLGAPTVWTLTPTEDGRYRLTGYAGLPEGVETVTVQEADDPITLRILLPPGATRDQSVLEAEVYYLPLLDEPGAEAPVDDVGAVSRA
jgi:hypothetical protein